MNHDPEKTTDSAPIDPTRPAMSRLPRNVCIALVLIGVVFLIEAYNLFRMTRGGWYPGVSRLVLVAPTAQCALLPVVCYQIANGRRWARLLLVVLTLMAFAWFCRNLAYIWWRDPEMWTLLIDPSYLVRTELPMLLGFAALYLLYFRSGDFFGRASLRR